MTDHPDYEAFEKWMIGTAKVIVGSSDPYPAGLERDYWRVWQAAQAALRADLSIPCVPASWQPIETAPRDGTRVILQWGKKAVTGFYLDNSKAKNMPWQGWMVPSMELKPSGQPEAWIPFPQISTAKPSAAPTPPETVAGELQTWVDCQDGEIQTLRLALKRIADAERAEKGRLGLLGTIADDALTSTTPSSGQVEAEKT